MNPWGEGLVSCLLRFVVLLLSHSNMLVLYPSTLFCRVAKARESTCTALTFEQSNRSAF